MGRRAGEVEKVYVQGDEIFRCGDIVTVKQFQQEPYTGRIDFIDYSKITIDTSKEFKSRSREVDLSSDAFIGFERVEEVDHGA